MIRHGSTMRQPSGENIAGIYMEGPYLNPNFGANRSNISFLGAADSAEYQELITECGKDLHRKCLPLCCSESRQSTGA